MVMNVLTLYIVLKKSLHLKEFVSLELCFVRALIFKSFVGVIKLLNKVLF